jgi:branched-subunit amino acid aminotransferase/4-amino-4-deoxychorismate lyase
VVRVTVFAPDLDLSRPSDAAEPHVLVSTRAAAALPLPALRLRTATYRRDLPSVKHVGLFETIRQRRLAQHAGFDDVLFMDARSRILEGATWNIGFHDGTRVLWPNAVQLPGVTMGLMKSLDGIDSATVELDLTASTRLSIAFATNAAFGVRPISAIDETRYDEHADILRELSNRYLSLPGEEL